MVTLTKGIAISAELPENKMPKVFFYEHITPPLLNNPELVNQVVQQMGSIVGIKNMRLVKPTMTGEDIGRYGLTKDSIPIAFFWLGSVNKEKYVKYTKEGRLLPSLHSPEFYPDFIPTFQTGVCSMTKTVIELMNK